MVQFRRLDPLANAGPYQRLLKSPVKSFTITEAQFDRVKQRRPELIVNEGDAAVLGVSSRDYLEIHYAFTEVEMFRDRFGDLFNRVVGASGKTETPRGVILSFRDRPNRNLAGTVFWSLALDEGPQWVEMNQFALPEQPEPGESLGEGYRIREASDADREAIATVEAEAFDQPRLSEAGLTSVYENARWLRLVEDEGGAPVACVSLRTDPGGWGVIGLMAIRPESLDALRKPLHDWCVAFLRNNGGRRIRRQVYIDDTATLALLREAGFTPGETGLDYTRPADAAAVKSKLDERQAHGSLIKFGDWR